MITQASPTNRTIDYIIDETCSNQSMTIEKTNAQKSQQSTDLPYETQTSSVSLNPKTKNTEINGRKSPSEATGFSLPTTSTLTSRNTLPLLVPTKIIRSNSVTYNDPNTSEKFTSQDNFSVKILTIFKFKTL